jgi:hypothetical protein
MKNEMIRDEHLDLIVADCRDMLLTSECVSWDGLAEAGWRATVAAIEQCREIRSPDTGQVLDAICAAWTEARP